jgi:ATP synthase protein I
MSQAPEIPRQTPEDGAESGMDKRGDAGFTQPNSGLGMAMRLGTELVVATMIGAGAGYWLDGYFGTEPWLLIIFLVFGAVAGFRNVYRIVQPVVGDGGHGTGNKSVNNETRK